MRRLLQLFAVLAILAMLGCSTPPPASGPNPEHVATSLRFIQNIGGGDMAYEAFLSGLEDLETEQPGMAALAERAFAGTTADDFARIAAPIYARHLSHEHLAELERYTRSPAIQRFFSLIYMSVKAGEAANERELMKQFSADELTEIIKFSRSPSVAAMKQSQPQINREFYKAGREWAEVRFNEYMDQQ